MGEAAMGEAAYEPWKKRPVSVDASSFSQAHRVADYARQTPRKVPGLADLHRMAMLLISEQAPGDARVLVVGAGGGLEVSAMAAAQPAWHFTGVDPSVAMLDIARATTAPFKARINLLEGTVDVAPVLPFDGAVCLLTLHFLERAERLRTLKEILRRLTPGARLVVAHHSMPDDQAASANSTQRWLTRSAAFANHADVDWVKATDSATDMAARLPLLSVSEEEAVLREAGFSNVALFYAAFSFRGWVATAG